MSCSRVVSSSSEGVESDRFEVVVGGGPGAVGGRRRRRREQAGAFGDVHVGHSLLGIKVHFLAVALLDFYTLAYICIQGYW